MSAPDIAGISAGLSVTQRAYLTTKSEWRSPDGIGAKRLMTFPPSNTLASLHAASLCVRTGTITPLGLAVRKHLMEQVGAG